MIPRLLAALLMTCVFAVQAQDVSYSRDIQPILTRNCVACHACYDAPCQLNLGNGEGLQRGASKLPVYNGTRTKAQETSRLYLDGHGEEAWRQRGFHSVVQEQASLMARMLELGRNNPLPANARLPDDLDIGINRENQCPLPGDFDSYARKHASAGMPFAVTGLADEDYATLQRWFAQGAPIEIETIRATADEQRQIDEWERLLNGSSARERLASRWLYEHLFLAHLHFDGGRTGHFFELVRSRTPSGQPVDPIATRRPNDDPGTDFHYRIRPVQGVIVHKTHITYPLSAQKLARTRQLLFAGDWQVERLPGYGAGHRSNPFLTFEAIPARSRYQFMLDNAEYFVRTFIRGPVCRGQIATDVIRDHFWVMFQQPGHDLYVKDAGYRAEATGLLSMPGQWDEIGDLLGLWRSYRDKRNQYEALRTNSYRNAPAPDWEHIWSGNDNALLTVFRHHDSASVNKGLIGGLPQTFWWMDYPLLERTYYQLVVNFDVFGNVAHQAQTRLYFDLIRNGAEQNFLRLMPADGRKAILDDWYQNGGQLKLWIDYQALDRKSPSGLQLSQREPLQQFADTLLERFASINATPDPINRCRGSHCHRPRLHAQIQAAEQSLSRLSGRLAAGLKVIQQLPEATLLRVEASDGSREVYSLLRNRAHSNVAFMLGESLRYQPRLDTLTIHPGVLSSYPNFIFNLPASEVPGFVRSLELATNRQDLEALVERWGIRRSHPEFWRYFHDMSAYIQETEPLEEGVLDMNRYQNL
ncbi:fatty acid cis/trans isomerase [Stutzerimonas kirkiae]|uniref:fatty acid cis/trans isomerase n=1 Tax=Stutzerimonas kirkiae TaxID=2211392 RepID=UPI0010382F43|nr:fatty acid cis/trans isomerase [Stutzerimonas kirkiae]TBV13519.1 peptidylprolyl isomerase [Stutzerimonas kirkiae]